MYLKASGANISADSLAAVFPEGRKAFLTTLRELRDLGVIRTSRQLVNGKYVTQSYLDGSPEKELLLLQIQQNSYNSVKHIHLKQTESTPEGSEEGKSMEWIDPDDLPDVIRKHNENKHKEKVEFHKKRHEEKMIARDPNNAALWSATDAGFEFAKQMFDIWHIEPWQVTRSRFIFAISNSRAEYGTKGDIELVMMKIFFGKIKHDTRLKDPEIIWKMFIKQYGSLLIEAQRQLITDEEVRAKKDEAEIAQQGKWDWMDNV